MPANQKSVFATEHTMHGGKLFKPGERMDNRGLPEHALKGALEGGVATDVASQAQAARSAEGERRDRVEREIASRSEKRDHQQRADVPQLVRLPDGSFARVEE